MSRRSLDSSGSSARRDRVLGPSDSSDSAADLVGVASTEDNSDRNGTGERMDVEGDIGDPEDIDLDRIVGEVEAGLGGGLDQAEEAQLGVTDEQLEGALANDDE